MLGSRLSILKSEERAFLALRSSFHASGFTNSNGVRRARAGGFASFARGPFIGSIARSCLSSFASCSALRRLETGVKPSICRLAAARPTWRRLALALAAPLLLVLASASLNLSFAREIRGLRFDFTSALTDGSGRGLDFRPMSGAALALRAVARRCFSCRLAFLA